MKSKHDVIIVGAGPAGTATAIQLAIMGLNVAIVERYPFPRTHVGICLSDRTLALLQYLGLGDEFHQAQFWQRNLTAVSWGRSETQFVPQPGFHVNRGVLDQLLLNKAEEAGVSVYQPAQMLKTQSLKHSGWQMTIEQAGKRQVLTGQFIVDASGRHSAFRVPTIKDSPSLLAIHAGWELKIVPEFDGLIESGEEAWLWYAQTARDKAVVSVFCDPRHVKSEKHENLQAHYEHLLQQFPLLQPHKMGQQCTETKACDASSYHSADPISNQHIRVGDACISVDPLSSQGVHLALLSALQAAVVVHTILKKPENTELAKQFFNIRMTERIKQFQEKTRNEYSRISIVRPEAFWHERGGNTKVVEPSITLPPTLSEPAQPHIQVQLSPDTQIEKSPVLDGVFVEEQQVLKHPNIDEAVAYLDGVNLIALLSVLPQKLSYAAIPSLWEKQIAPSQGQKITSWLWEKRILIEAN